MIAAAVVGCGRMGAFTSPAVREFAPPCWFPLSHADAIAAHPALSLDGFCDNDPAAVERARAAFGTGYGTIDFTTLLTEVRPQLLGIATRTIGRSDIIVAGQAAGVRAMHVEKPLCNSVAELDALNAAMSDDALFMTLGTVRRFMAEFVTAKQIAQSGRFGALLEIRVNFGAASLYWTHPHAVDLILDIAGGRQVADVTARLSGVIVGNSATTIQSDPVIDYATIRFDDGVTGYIGRAPGSSVEIVCESGIISVVGDGRAIELLASEGGAPYPLRQPYDLPVNGPALQGTFGPIDQLVQCIAGNTDAMAANRRVRRDIVTGQRLLFAIAQSHLEGARPVALADVDPTMVILAETGGRFA